MAKYRFKPGLVPTLLVLLLMPIFIRLGFWQLERAEQKQGIQRDYERRARLPAFQLEPRVSAGEELEYRRIYVSGQFDNQHQILIDNKIHNGKVGYYVITPLRMTESDQYVLVNRGWLPAGQFRHELPNIDVTEKLVTLHGVLVRPRRDIFMISAKNRENDRWPLRMQWLDKEEVAKLSGLNLYPFAILMDADGASGYIREWGSVNLDPNKNTSYAMQWFSFAVVLLLIYLVVNIEKREES